MTLRATARPLASLAVLVAVMLAGVWSLQPPDPPQAEPSADQFSVARAMWHVVSVGTVPHSIGSPAHDKVRRYILNQLAASGVEILEQSATVVRNQGRNQVAAVMVRNLTGRLKGTSGGQAILLAAHYDSAPAAPGAADDGHGVAVLLETLRALEAVPPLRNDVIFVFTDAEEVGLWGARAFVDSHPWRRDVRVVLNFEARGTRGPVWMFRTNPGSGWLVSAFASAAPYAQASSMGEDIIRYMPNDTDLTEFRRLGVPGLDFAFIDQPMYYHSVLDSPANLDGRSLYQQGANALAVVRRLGGMDLSSPPSGEALTYHGASKTGVLRYPKSLALPLALLAAALVAVGGVIGVLRGKVTWRGVLGGLAGLVLAVAATFLIAWYIDPLFRRGRSGQFAYGYRYAQYHLAFAAIGLTLAAAVFGWLFRRSSLGSLWTGALVLWAVLAVASGAYFPGASFVFAWPLLAAASAQLVLLMCGDSDLRHWWTLVLYFAISAPAAFLMGQLIPALMVSFPSGGAAPVAVFAVLLTGLLLPHVKLIEECGPWKPPCILAAAGLLLLARATLSPFDARHPRANTLLYGLNADANRAFWLTPDDVTDEYTAKYLGPGASRAPVPQFLPTRTDELLQSPAPLQPYKPSSVVMTANRADSDGRVLQLQVTPSRMLTAVYLYLEQNSGLTACAVNGVSVPMASRSGRSIVMLGAIPMEGAAVELRLTGTSAPLRVHGVDRFYGTPAAPRPPGFMQHPFAADMTLISKSHEFIH